MTCYSQQMLEAFHDGQLQGAEQRRVAAHVALCPICRAEVDQMERLSAALHHCPVPQFPTTAARFEAQVRLRLPPREPSALQRQGWVVPVILVGAWAFVQAVWLVSSVLLVAGSLGLTSEAGLTWLLPGGTGLGRILQAWEPGWRGALTLLSYAASTLASLLVPLVLLGGIAVLFWAWWFLWQHRAALNQG